MASKTANVKVQGPYDTAANWANSTRILLNGEKVYAKVDSGSVRSKTGDGTKTFSQLPYDDEAIYQSLSGKAAANLGNVQNSDFLAKAAASGISSMTISSEQPADQNANDVWYKTL